MMAAVLPSSTPIAASKPNERHTILTDLLDAVKQCQIRFGGRAELATESDLRVAVLCNRLETALSHGLRFKPLTKNSSTIRQVTEIVSSSLHLNRGQTHDHLVFWHYVREHLTRHEFERYLVLKQVWTDTGRGRAWLRSALNERSLERYLHSLLGSTEHIAVFYEDWAFVADQERSSMLTTMAAGLGSILFAISIDNLDLNQPRTRRESPEPIVLSMSNTEPTLSSATADATGTRRRRRRVPANIISFDDDDDEDNAEGRVNSSVHHIVSSSAPSTCLSSPANENSTPQSRHDQAPVSPRASSASSHETASKRPTELKLSQPSGQQDPPPTSIGSPASSKGASPDFTRKSREPRARAAAQTLTPVNNVGVGELIPVPRRGEEPPSEEDSASVPSLSEDTDCMRNGEVRQAVLSLLSHKDDLQAEARALRRLLETANDANAELQAERDEAQRGNKEKLERLDSRIQALTRENELLKHQLRKYVAAVQMLKRDGTQAHEALAGLEAAQAQAPAPDYHHEAQEYEKKLIQVAEMHGELMEFNERLHRLILRKDTSLRRLRDELVELRGPLPDDAATDDDEVSVVSEPTAAATTAASRTLVNIWIPSAFLTGGSADVHHVYQVFIRIRDDEWNIYRRYSQFHSLHKELKKKDSAIATFDFPPKKTLGNKDACFVEERRRRLQHYLRCVVNQLGQSNVELATSPDKDLLISLVPFFGEVSTVVEDKGRRKRASSRNPFSRLGRNSDSNQPSIHSPQYTGL